MQSRHCAGAGGWRSPQCLGKSFPKSGLSPPGARRPLPLLPPTPLPWQGLERTPGAPPRLDRLGFGKGWRAAEAFPRVCGKSGSGKSFSKFPAASAQVASAGRGDGGERASLAAASTELWARLLGAARVPGGQALLPGAKAAADAGGSEGGSRPPQLLRPYRGAYTWGLHRSPGRAPRGRSSGRRSGCLRATGSSTFLLGSFPLAPGFPGQWSACGGSPAAMPPGRSRNFQALLNSFPSPATPRKGACPEVDTPLMNINNRACALLRVLRRGGQSESRLPDRRSGSPPRARRARVIVLPAAGRRARLRFFFFFFLRSLPLVSCS